MASKTISKEKKLSKSVSGCIVNGNSKNGRDENKSSANGASAMSHADKLTMRAWKHTYANRLKNQDKECR